MGLGGAVKLKRTSLCLAKDTLISYRKVAATGKLTFNPHSSMKAEIGYTSSPQGG